MPKPVRTANQVRIDIPQAIKRAFMHRGLLVGGHRRSAPAQQPENSISNRTEITKTSASARLGEKKGTDNPDPGAKSAKAPDNLAVITRKSLDVLYEAETIFPFTLFPDTITLDREKLTIADRFFWRIAKITSTPISEIMSCEANVGPFFGSLHLTFRFFTDNQRTVSFLTRNDAIQMQRLIHGFIIAHRREIDTTNIEKDKLVELLTELGQGASD